MIKSIRLVNWRSHSDTSLEFQEGTNLLIGIMGAGKSSVLEAIAFSLFGTFPALERRKVKLDDIFRLNEPKAQTILEFKWNETVYRVERTLERNKRGVATSAELYKSGSLLEHGTVAVNDQIHNLTGVDYDLFTRAIYAEQNNIDYFLTLDPKRRKQDIDTLLGLDRFEDARTNAVTVFGRFKTKRLVLEEKFNPLHLAESETKEKSLAEALTTDETKQKETAAALAARNLSQEGLAKDFHLLRAKKELFERLGKDEATISGRLQQLREESAGFDSSAFESSKSKITALLNERAKFAEKTKTLDSEAARLAREMGQTEAKIKSALDAKARSESLKKEQENLLGDSKPEALASKLAELEQISLSSDSERKSLEHEVAEIIDLIPRLKPGSSHCPLCASSLAGDAVAHIKAEKEQEIAKKRTRIAELTSSSTLNRKDIETLKVRIRRISLITETLAPLEQNASTLLQIEQAREKLRAEQVRLKEARDHHIADTDKQNQSIEQEKVVFTKLEAAAKRKTEADVLDKKLFEIKEQLKAASFSPEKYETLRTKLETAKLDCANLASERTALDKQIQHTKELLGVAKKELANLRALATEIKSLSDLESELSFFRNALLETQTSLRSSLVEAINSAMNEIWPIFYPYRNYSALRLSATEKDYVFEVLDNGEWKNLESIASGGERASAALALRVALAMVLTPNLSWLILDEPTHNLDHDTIELLSETLQTKVPQVVRQTFVITHEEGLMGSEFASTYRLTRNKERNGETKVERV